MPRAILIPLTAAAAVLSACGEPSAAQDVADPGREQIEEIVRAYILENPEIIEEALIELQMRAIERERRAQQEAVEANLAALVNDPRDPVIGAPAEPAVEIVEFFDYKCGFCRQTNDWLRATLAQHGDRVRFVMKEYPVLSAESREAARAALGVHAIAPEQYLDFHNALFEASGPLTAQRIDQIAADLGLDPAEVRAAAADEAVSAHLADVRDLGRQLNVTGTPFFVINGEVVSGADIGRLNQLVARGLEDAS